MFGCKSDWLKLGHRAGPNVFVKASAVPFLGTSTAPHDFLPDSSLNEDASRQPRGVGSKTYENAK
jgi:hypothetical protein